MLRTLSAFALVGLVGATGCSSKSSGGPGSDDNSSSGVNCSSASCPVCTGPTAADAGATVSFSNDVLPVFQRSCGIGAGTCHGAYPGMPNSSQDLYLAEPSSADDGYGDAGAILSGIVGKPSLEAPSMNIVTAGNPDQSYLIHKINGDMCSIMSECAAIGTLPTTTTVPCGVQMPQTGGTIGPTDQTLIWNWVLQGAQNN